MLHKFKPFVSLKTVRAYHQSIRISHLFSQKLSGTLFASSSGLIFVVQLHDRLCLLDMSPRRVCHRHRFLHSSRRCQRHVVSWTSHVKGTLLRLLSYFHFCSQAARKILHCLLTLSHSDFNKPAPRVATCCSFLNSDCSAGPNSTNSKGVFFLAGRGLL